MENKNFYQALLKQNYKGGKSKPKNKKLYNKVKSLAKKKFKTYPSAVANAWLVKKYKSKGGKYE
jgi:hypothetical protein